TAAHRFPGAIRGLDLATGEGVEAPQEAHALLPPDHVDLDRAGRAGAHEQHGGGGTGSDGSSRRGRHAGGTRDRVSPASCSSSASADTGLAMTRSTNCMDSCAETPSPQPVRMKTAVAGERILMRSA